MLNRTRVFVSIVALAVTLSGLSKVRAGNCQDDFEVYIKQVEDHAAGKKGSFNEGFECLAGEGAGCVIPVSDDWIGDKAAQCIADARNAPAKPRLVAACEKVVGRKKDKHAMDCFQIVASVGVGKLGQRDVFTELTRGNNKPTALDLTYLGDVRAIPVLIERFKAAARRADSLSKQKERTTGEKARWKMDVRIQNTRDEQLQSLNALWHFADPNSAAFLTDVANSASDPKVKEHAQKALARTAAP